MKFISLGCNCDVKIFFKDNIRVYDKSLPFDWIWSNIDFLIKTFSTDYFEFTEVEKLHAFWVSPYPFTYIVNNNCTGETHRICSALSLHDADYQSEEQYISNIPNINEKYKRRFHRLYNILDEEDKVICIRKILPSEQGAINQNVDTKEKVIQLANILNNKFKSNIFIFLVDEEQVIDNDINNEMYIKRFNSFADLQTHLDTYVFNNPNITNFLNKRGFNWFEGYSQEVPNQVLDLIELTQGNNIKHVLEIGFNAGHSAEIFLKNNNSLMLTSFDLGNHNYLTHAKEFIDNIYTNRHTLLIGDSTITIPKYINENSEQKFDVIFIDGGNSYDIAKSDLENCARLAHKDTIVIMDDTTHTNLNIIHTVGPTTVWNEFLRDNKIIEINRKEYGNERGMSWGKYNL